MQCDIDRTDRIRSKFVANRTPYFTPGATHVSSFAKLYLGIKDYHIAQHLIRSEQSIILKKI